MRNTSINHKQITQNPTRELSLVGTILFLFFIIVVFMIVFSDWDYGDSYLPTLFNISLFLIGGYGIIYWIVYFIEKKNIKNKKEM